MCSQISYENMVLMLFINVIKPYVNVPIYVKVFILEPKISTLKHKNDKSFPPKKIYLNILN